MDAELDSENPYAEDATEPGEPIIEHAEEADDVVPFEYSITSYGADYPVDGLVKRLADGDIIVPPFQRAYVWEAKRASKFIESLLLGLPVPGIFLSREEPTSRLLVIDGQQRLRTLQYFYRGYFEDETKRFALSGVQTQFDGITYGRLDVSNRRRLDDSIIHATVVRQDVPTDDNSSIYHLFARLNTGGLQLTSQEIRACIYHGELNALLHDLNGNEGWRRIFGPVNKRMRDQELILRFSAFFFEADRFERSLKGFLNTYMARNRALRRQSKDQLIGAFVPTIELLDRALGQDAFRPRRSLNAAVFDSVMVGLARRLAQGPAPTPAAIARSYRSLLALEDFVAATETATNDPHSISTRLALSTRAFGPT